MFVIPLSVRGSTSDITFLGLRNFKAEPERHLRPQNLRKEARSGGGARGRGNGGRKANTRRAGRTRPQEIDAGRVVWSLSLTTLLGGCGDVLVDKAARQQYGPPPWTWPLCGRAAVAVNKVAGR